jgi:hypothetical protein
MTEPPFDRASRLTTCLPISGGTTGEIYQVSHSQFAGKIPELRPTGGKEPAQPSSFAKLLHSIGPQARSTPQALKNAGQLGRNRGLPLAEQPPCIDSQQNMEVVVHDGETTDSNGEDLAELFEPAFDPLPTVGETFTKEEGAAHTAVDAVIPTSDREIDEPRTSGSRGEPP